MRLETLGLNGIAGFDGEETLTLDPGFTVALGGNGSGKTAIVWLLHTVFLGADPSDDRGYVLPEAETAWAELVFEHDGRRCAVRRDFLLDEVRITALDEDAVIYEGQPDSGGERAEYWAAVDRVLGAGFLNRWLRTAVVSELDLDSHRDSGFHPADAITEREEDEVLDSLRKEAVSLTGAVGDGAVPGQIALVAEELASRRAALEAWADATTRIQGEMERLQNLERELEEAQNAAAAREGVYETLTRFHDLSQERSRLEQSLQDLRSEREAVRQNAEAVETAQKRLEEEYGEFLNADTDLDETLQEWTDATARMHDIQRRIRTAQEAVSKAPRTNTGRNGTIAAVVLGLLGFLACLGAAAPGMGYVIAPLLAVMGFGAIWAKDRSVQTLLQTRYQELDALETENADVEKTLAAAKSTLGKLGNHGHPMAIRRAVLQYWKAREEVEVLRADGNRHPPLHEVVNAFEEVLESLKKTDAEARELVAEAKYLAGLDDSPAALAGEVDMARSQQDASRSRADRIERERDELRDSLFGGPGEFPVLGHLDRDCREFEARGEFLERRAQAIEAAIEELTEAVESYRSGHEQRLVDRAGRHLRRFTGGRLDAVRFTDHKVLEARDEDGRWQTAPRLSRGMAGQLDVAVRLARVQEGFGGECAPLVLDESFLLWDRASLEPALGVLAEYATAGGQVLLLTHDDAAAGLADALLQLDRDPAPRKLPRRAA